MLLLILVSEYFIITADLVEIGASRVIKDFFYFNLNILIIVSKNFSNLYLDILLVFNTYSSVNILY